MIDAFLFAVSAFLSAFAAFIVLSRRRSQAPSRVPTGVARLLFSGRTSIDTDAEGAVLLEGSPDGPDDLSRLRASLEPTFDLADMPFDTVANGRCRQLSRDGRSELVVEGPPNARRITLRALEVEDRADVAFHSHRALEAELEVLRANTQISGMLVWRQNATGDIVWINDAYLDLAADVFGKERAQAWPLPRLFPQMTRSDASLEEGPMRCRLTGSTDTHPRWFDCTVAEVGGEKLFSAIERTDAVIAETRLREFMQTLTKTFAQLPIGMAIFDRDRELVLFNPALIELTGLPAELLTRRPTLVSFFDTLRERRMMPERRNYKEWREAIANLEAAAADGSFEETWSLSEGQTYQVTGRPHPDGAIAILFEDISSEISQTRRYRSELDLSQSVLDGLEPAIAVFSPSGALSMANNAYTELWGHHPEDSLGAVTIADATRHWASKSLPSPAWGDLRDFVGGGSMRVEWQSSVRLKDGRLLDCRFTPLSTCATLVVFEPRTAAAETGKSEGQQSVLNAV